MTTAPKPKRASRFHASLGARLQHGGATHSCETVNLSRTGALLALPGSAPTESEVVLALETPNGDLRVHLVARVVHTEPGTDGRTRVGVQFADPGPREKKTLAAMVSRLVEGNSPAALASLKPGSKPDEIRKALENMPVVHRMQLAGRAMAQERQYLRQDSNPQVLDALSRNPNINLTEIKMLVRNQALRVATLESIASDPRWKRDQELKVLLTTHPRITYKLAETLVGEMNERSVQQALRRPGFPLELKTALLSPLTRNKIRR